MADKIETSRPFRLFGSRFRCFVAGLLLGALGALTISLVQSYIDRRAFAPWLKDGHTICLYGMHSVKRFPEGDPP